MSGAFGQAVVYLAQQIEAGATMMAIVLTTLLPFLPDSLVEQPEKIIKELSQHLEDHGKLILAVPNFESFDAQYYKAQWAALDVPRHLWHFAPKGIIKLLENANFTFKASHPLWFDAFYIASLSEKYSNKKFSFLRGMFIGLLSNIKALFNGAYSSLIFVFEKQTRTSND